MRISCSPTKIVLSTGIILSLLLLMASPAALGEIYEDTMLYSADRQSHDQLGWSVSASGSTALVGAPYDDDNGSDSGSAYIFRYDSVSEAWIEEAKLLPSDGASHETFGWSVSLSGDVALISAPHHDGFFNSPVPGSAYIFRYNPVTATWIEEAKLVAAGGRQGDEFGYAVSLDGGVAAVGAPYSDTHGNRSGSAYLFRYDDPSGLWFEQAEVLAPDGEADDQYGTSLSVLGNRVVVGSPIADGLTDNVGALYEYLHDPGSGQWIYASKIVASEMESGGGFGYSVAMTGDTIVAGAPFHVFPDGDCGSVHFFRCDAAGIWSETAVLRNEEGHHRDCFGFSVAIDGDVALIGARWSENPYTSAWTGAAFKYRYNSGTGTWILEDKLLDSVGLFEIWLGYSVALSGEAALVGAPLKTPPGIAIEPGAVLVYGTPDDEPVIRVPSDHATIQAAIDAAPETYTILVEPGTYVENIDFKGKSIIVRSTEGPDRTVIDGGQAGPVVTFTSPAREGAWLDGFTITNGSAAEGGGIHCDAAWTIITGNIVIGNTAAYGGGIYCTGFDPIVFGNAVMLNSVTRDGGGIFFRFVTGDASLISHNFILANATDGAANHDGGGIAFMECVAPVISNLVAGNSAYTGGGLYYDFGLNSVVTNNTFFGNTAVSSGGGIHFGPEGATGVMTNTIVWDNTAPTWPEIDMGSGSVSVTYCDVKGGWNGEGNIDADPLFADAALWDFHLTWDSPCREVGTNAAAGLPEFDFEGDPRSAFAMVDMGADEFYTHLYHVGRVMPGSVVEIKVVGSIDFPVMLFLGARVYDPPSPTQHGGYYLDWPPLWRGQVGRISANGLLVAPTTVPPTWSSGELYHLQALVGPWNGSQTLFTNYDVLAVE